MVKKGSGREVKVKLCESGRQEKINAARAALFPIALFNDNELSFGTLFAVKPVCGADQKMVYGVAHYEHNQHLPQYKSLIMGCYTTRTQSPKLQS